MQKEETTGRREERGRETKQHRREQEKKGESTRETRK